MNGKKSMMISVVAAALALAYPFAWVTGDSGGKCAGTRPLDASEKSRYRAIMQVIQKAMPPAPEGWTTQEAMSVDIVPVSIYESPGCPLGAIYQASFTNEKGIMEQIKNFEKSKSSARMDKLAAEISSAAEQGDSKKLQKLQNEMESLNSTPAGKMTASILVRINLVHTVELLKGGRVYALAGSKFAYLREDKNGKKLVFYIGRWNRREESGVCPEIVKSPSNVDVQILEILIEGDSAEQLAQAMNMKALNALVK